MTTSVYFSNHSIRVVSGSANKNVITVKHSSKVNLPHGTLINGVITNENEVKFTVAKLWADNKLPMNDIHIVIDSSSIITKGIIVPKTKDENIISVIKKEFEDVETTEERIFDYSVLTPALDEGGAEILACAAEKSFIESYIDIFEALGKKAKITSIDIALNSIIKFWKFVPELRSKTAIVAVLDANVLCLTLFVNGKYRFTNRSRLIEERGLPQSVDEISNLLSSMIQFNRSERSGFDITDVFFCGLSEDEDDLCRNVKNMLDVENITEFPNCSGSIRYVGKSGSNSAAPVPSEYLYCLGNIVKY